MAYFDFINNQTYSSFLHYKEATNIKYNLFKESLTFIQRFSKKYTNNDFELAIKSLEFNKDSLSVNEKEKLSILKELSLKNSLITVSKAFKFLVNFSKKYTNNNLYKAMESLQFNQDCLTSSEKKLFFILMSIR